MKAASLKEIKTELESMNADGLSALLQRLARFKKENKELLTYLLFEANNEESYISSVKEEIDHQLLNLNLKNIHLAKKTIRKIIRTANKFIRYSGEAQTEIQVLMHVCTQIKETGLNFSKSTALTNIYASLIKRINKAIDTLHEDLQYDFLKEMERLSL